jgi:two-component system cell cycle response regulator
MPPLARPPVCPAGMEVCPVLSEFLRLQEECRRLKELSQTDPLTGLYNRRYLMSSLGQEMERTLRTGLPTSLIMLDLDHFKRLNDTYGHQFGDAVLVRVAVLLKENVRKLDVSCRYGGEEFALVLPGTRLPQAVRMAVRLKDTLAKSWKEPQGGNGRLTASFGVETYTGREEMTPKSFLQQADHWLFLAKAQGRNTVCHRDSPQAGPEVGLSPEERRVFLSVENPHDRRADGSYG